MERLPIYRNLVYGELPFQDIPPKDPGGERRKFMQFTPTFRKHLIVTEGIHQLCIDVGNLPDKESMLEQLITRLVKFCLENIHNDRYANFAENNRILDSLKADEILTWNEDDIVDFVDMSLHFYFGENNQWLHNILNQVRNDDVDDGRRYNSKFFINAEEMKYKFTMMMYYSGLSLEQIEDLTIDFVADAIIFFKDHNNIQNGKKCDPKTGKVRPREKSFILRKRINTALAVERRNKMNKIRNATAYKKVEKEKKEMSDAEKLAQEEYEKNIKEHKEAIQALNQSSMGRSQRAIYNSNKRINNRSMKNV